MKVITPVQVNNTNLISTNVTEVYPAWSAVTNYTAGTVVSYLDEGVYECLQPSLNNPPSSSSTYWLRLVPTNKLAMFDDQVSTPSTMPDEITVTIKTGFLDSLAILGIVGNLVTVTVRDDLNGNIIYEQSQSLQGETVYDWYQYFFFDVNTQRTQAIFTNIPSSFGNSHTTVSITSQGNVSIGSLIFGTTYKLGNTEYGVNSGVIDYSRKETDDFGVTTFVKRAYSKRLTAKVSVRNAELNRVQRVLYNLRATPALWIASDDPTYEEPLVVFGFYRDFSTEIPYPTMSYCNLEIEGLI